MLVKCILISLQTTFSLNCSSLRSIHFPKKKMDVKLEIIQKWFLTEKEFPAQVFGLTWTLWYGWDLEVATASSELKASGHIMGRSQVSLKQRLRLLCPLKGLNGRWDKKDSGGPRAAKGAELVPQLRQEAL